MSEAVNNFFGVFVEYLGNILFWQPIDGFPLIILVLLFGTITFTIYYKFINFRAFSHSIDVIKGKYDNPNDTGQISHFQALTSALSATIGLGNIASVAIAVSNGGPGAVFWMMFIAVFGMTAKFVSATLGQMYRTVHKDGSVSGGPMYYLDQGLSEKGGKFYSKLGKTLGVMYALFIIGGALGGGNMFQVNQGLEIISDKIIYFENNPWVYGFILMVLVSLVIIGGIKRIGSVTEKIVPAMVLIYVGVSLYIIIVNISELPDVVSSIFNQAFTPEAFRGGLLGVLVLGIKRAVFSNEGGVGSASIAHSAAKTDEPVREGIVAMIGPFIDTILVCFMTASVILITADKNEPLKEHTSTLKYKWALESSKNNSEAKEFKKDNLDNIVKMYKNYINSPINDKEDGKTTHLKALKNKNKEKSIFMADFKSRKLNQSKIDSEIKIIIDGINGIEPPKEEHMLVALKTKSSNGAKGALYTSEAFGSAVWWFPYILMIAVFLFSYSTMISWYYYGEKGLRYLTNSTVSIKLYQGIFLFCTYIGAVTSMLNVKEFSDMMILSCAFPNIIGAMFLLPKVKEQLETYWGNYKKGKFKTYK